MLTRYSMRSLVLGLVVVLSASLSSSPCLGGMYDFTNITHNGNPDVGSQLRFTIAGAGTTTIEGIVYNQVSFTFNNSGPVASSIDGVYFHDGTLLGISSITNGPTGVSFSDPADPVQLPGQNEASPRFVTHEGFTADSDPPSQPNGVNPGEWVQITFALLSGQTFNDTITALGNGSLRIGVHVAAIGGETGGSDSYVNDPVVPLPGAVLLGMLGLSAAGLKLRRYA